jgi:hypothetical protein
MNKNHQTLEGITDGPCLTKAAAPKIKVQLGSLLENNMANQENLERLHELYSRISGSVIDEVAETPAIKRDNYEENTSFVLDVINTEAATQNTVFRALLDHLEKYI